MIDLDENKTPEAIIAEAMVSAGAPLMHSRVEEAVAGALRKAGMLAEQSGQVCAWCPSPARGSAHHNDGKLHPSCGQTNHGQGWVPDYPVERIGAIEAERDAALARIARAWELHEPFTWSFGYGPVQSCKWCAENGVPQEVASWPCATIRALEEGGIDDGFQED